MEFYIAQAISVVMALFALASMQFKNLKMVIACQIVSNVLCASTYFLLGGFSGAGICLVAIIQSVVYFVLNYKKIKPPLYVAIIFVCLFISCSVIYYKSPIDLLSAGAAVFFALSMAQKSSSRARIVYLLNPIFWTIYDIFTLAYVNTFIHSAIFISTLFAIIRLDILKREKIKKEKTQ